MKIIVSAKDIERLLNGRSFCIPVRAGRITIHDLSYTGEKFCFLLDYSLKKNIRCEGESWAMAGGWLEGALRVHDTVAKVLLKLLSRFSSLSGKGVECTFPDVRFDLSRFALPFVPETVECLPGEVHITGELRTDILFSGRIPLS